VSRRARRGRPTIAWATHAALVPLAILVMVPIAWMTVAAFKDAGDQFSSFFLPSGDGLFGVGWERLTLDHFGTLFSQTRLGGAFVNTVFLSSVGALAASADVTRRAGSSPRGAERECAARGPRCSTRCSASRC